MAKIELTKKELVFCNTYLTNGENGADAARTAGFPHDRIRACQLLDKPHIQEYIEKRRAHILQKLEDEFDIKCSWIIERLVEVIECSLVSKKGKKVLLNHKAVLAATDQICKIKGFYAPTKQENSNTNRFSDEQAQEMKSILRECLQEM